MDFFFLFLQRLDSRGAVRMKGVGDLGGARAGYLYFVMTVIMLIPHGLESSLRGYLATSNGH